MLKISQISSKERFCYPQDISQTDILLPLKNKQLYKRFVSVKLNYC